VTVFAQDFEGGTDGETISTSNSDFDSVIVNALVTSNSPSFSSEHVRGSLAMKLSGAATRRNFPEAEGKRLVGRSSEGRRGGAKK
jgi:hypothetical protein